MKKISVLIVDDSPLIRRIFSDALNAEPDIEVVGTAVDPYDAREKIKALDPRVVTLDIEMPRMDGLSFLEKIMTLRPTRVIMVSTLTQRGAAETMRAFEIGAIDCIAKPMNGDFKEIGRELADKVRAAAGANISRRPRPAVRDVNVLEYVPPTLPRNEVAVIAIGSSTGGVEALRHIFSQLPATCPPVVIAQHMPATFTAAFAARLGDISQMRVSEARDGDILKRGHAFVAPGGRHLSVKRVGQDLICRLSDAAPVSGHKPSVDVLFSSVADAVGGRALGAILTGMGKDGASGMERMREAGSYNIGQSRETCIVYGMPGAAARLGAVHAEVDLRDIAAHLLAHCSKEEADRAAVHQHAY